jgi:hypothetical protein
VFSYTLKKPLFDLGEILIAPEIVALGVDAHSFLRRHQYGDFGCIEPYDTDQNLHAIETGDGILSQYSVAIGKERILICVMTESDRSFTVVFILNKSERKSPESPDRSEDP